MKIKKAKTVQALQKAENNRIIELIRLKLRPLREKVIPADAGQSGKDQ